MPQKFLLIKAISHNLWKNLHHVMELLLVAEITGRKPIVYWGCSCLYQDVLYNNAFDLYFEPISDCDIYDVINKKFTFYPPIWTYDNLTSDDPNKSNLCYRNIGDFIGSQADVVISDVSIYITRIIPFITKDHPTYAMTPLQIYRYLFDKYLKLKPDIKKEIEQYYDTNLGSANHVLAIHMPGDFTLDIYPQIKRYNINMIYHPVNPNTRSKSKKPKKRYDHFKVDDTIYQHEIVRLLKVTQHGDPYKILNKEVQITLKNFHIDKIFLITDREDILEEFSLEFGSMLFYSNYKRTPINDSREPVYIENHLNNRSKGIEILRDTYIATMCDFFIGYGFSNLSYGVTHLKDWPETNIKLTYWMFEKLYNFSYERIKTGRYSPEEADGKYRLMTKMTKNSIKKVQRVFK
ncbi:hypothetical protein [Lachnotalea glycerini]|uniref:Uncharacterized protein n=1 Tax=Lachnotalea glycerini TaxID=1763509 RepID=A0A371JD39_9FIRM|nr:hypothetical protein [Lachnotalea glycerini]RDY30577.1 hypothetical protein CG710_013950 [Lachnotalea glycerini]